MDPISIGLGLLALFSAVMSVGQAIETWTLWKVKKDIPVMIKVGSIAMLKDPEFVKQIFTQEIFDALALSLWENFKNYMGKQLEGQMGKQAAGEKRLEKEFVNEIAPFISLLPDKWKDKLEANPQLVPFFIQLAQRFGPMLMQQGGQQYGR